MAALTALMQETLSVSGILLTKTFGRQKYAQDRFEQENQKLTDLEIRQQMIGRWFFMFIGTFFSITPAVVYLVAGLQIISNPLHSGISLGGIVAFTTLQSRIFFPIGQLLNVQVEIQGALALFDRIFEYLDMPIEIQDAPNALHLNLDEVRGEVTFKDVTFTYKRDERVVELLSTEHSNDENGKAKRTISPEPVAITETTAISAELASRPTLKDISFDIQPGQLAALVGPSGAGKTTITYLVPRLYDVDSGAVEIDGHNVKNISLASLGEVIGVVTQETYLFHASIRENLLYARPNATEEEMIAAAKAAAIHDRVMELDDGYDTMVREGGNNFSAGQRQRLAISRAILRDTPILILDEPTANLDVEAEAEVMHALNNLTIGRTVLMISHRLSTLGNVDEIIVMNAGQVVERGTFKELKRLGGIFTRMLEEQNRYNLDRTEDEGPVRLSVPMKAVVPTVANTSWMRQSDDEAYSFTSQVATVSPTIGSITSQVTTVSPAVVHTKEKTSSSYSGKPPLHKAQKFASYPNFPLASREGRTLAAYVHIHVDGKAATVHALQKPFLTIGRYSKSDIQIASPRVSRRHAHLELKNGKWFDILTATTQPSDVTNFVQRVRPEL